MIFKKTTTDSGFKEFTELLIQQKVPITLLSQKNIDLQANGFFE